MDDISKSVAQERLLTTKLYIPPWRTEQVARHRLIMCLQEGLQRRLTLVCAAAGSGKTTLLSEWFATLHATNDCSTIIAWLSLDKEDNDSARFWSYVVAALRTVCSTIDDTLLDLLPTTSSATIQPFLTALVNSVGRIASDCVLILDDYHVIHAQDIHDALTFLLDYLPLTMHIFIASRTDPPLPLARLRARKQLVELRSPDLRFTHKEVEAFLRQTLPISLSREEIAALEMRTEGWIAGLQLAVLSLSGQTDTSVFITNFTGSHRYIVDYLVEEVLYRLPERVQTFLLTTCMLDRLCGPLCDVLTDRADGQELLEWLEQANIFLVPLDNERRWYRYHHLFADVLLHRLRSMQPDTVSEQHRRAAVWYEERGEIAQSIEHTLSGNDFARAVELIKRAGGALMGRGEMHTLLRWLELLPDALVRSHIKLCIFYAWTLLSAARWEDAERWVHDAERLLGDEKEQATIDTIMSNIIAVRGALASTRGDGVLAIELAQRAIQSTAEDDPRRSYMTLHLAMAYWLHGDGEHMAQTLLETCRISLACGHIYIYLHAVYSVAQWRGQQGDLQQAFELLQEALQVVEGRSPSPALSVIQMGIGEIFYEWNDLPMAMQYLDAGIESGLRSGDLRLLPYNYMMLARVKFSLGDKDGAYTMMQKVQECLQAYNVMHTTSHVAARVARLYLALGDQDEAERWLRKGRTAPAKKVEPAYLYESEDITRARFSIAQGDSGAALELLQPLLLSATAEKRTGSFISLLIVQALALRVQGDSAQALQKLAWALSLAEPQRYIRIFVDEGEPMLSLLCELRALLEKRAFVISYVVSVQYVDRLLMVFGVTENQHLTNGVVYDEAGFQSNPLSERELEIVRLIAVGLSNQQITERLTIALSTLKTHINHIYSKLDVRRRTQAVARARTLKLL